MQLVWFKLASAQYAELFDQIRQCRRLIDALHADFEQLQGQHRALRSTFYATRGSPKAPPNPPPGSRAEKDQILTQFLGGKRVHDTPESGTG